jgi:hypothetical protein
MLLPTVVLKMPACSDIQWHNVYTQFLQNPSVGY